MTVVRRFLMASSLARLVATERGSSVITEGYFPPQQGRNSHVVVDGERCALILVTEAEGGLLEERTEVPRVHADALIDVCAGTVSIERSSVAMEGGGAALIERMTHPGPLDSVTIEFDNSDEAEAFAPPDLFGPEITLESSYGRQVIALHGLPTADEVPLSNATLEALLDLLENQSEPDSVPAVEGESAAKGRPSLDSSVLDALRSLSALTVPGRQQ
jgi:CYTH domain-containing protein